MKKKILCVAGIIIFIFGGSYAAAKEILFEENFDKFEEGEEAGFEVEKELGMEVQGLIASGEKGKALKVFPVKGVEYKDNIIALRRDMFIPNEETLLTFSYYLKGVKSLEVLSRDKSIRENCSFTLDKPVYGKWSKVTVKFSELKPKNPEWKVRDGDEFANIRFRAEFEPKAKFEDIFIILDDIKLTIGEEEKSGGGKK